MTWPGLNPNLKVKISLKLKVLITVKVELLPLPYTNATNCPPWLYWIRDVFFIEYSPYCLNLLSKMR